MFFRDRSIVDKGTWNDVLFRVILSLLDIYSLVKLEIVLV